MTIYPPKESFIFWDAITGNAPVNDYSILGYQMLVMAYIMILISIPIGIKFLYVVLNIIEEIVPGKFDINGIKKPSDKVRDSYEKTPRL